jgi:hypothetical protein
MKNGALLALLIFLVCSWSMVVGGKEVPSSLSQWLPTQTVLEGNWLAANNCGTTWDVYLDAGIVKVRPYEHCGSSNLRGLLKFADGNLYSENKGEWGTKVYWRPTTGKDEQISDIPVEQFIKMGKRFFAIAGLAHMGTNSGEVLEVKRTQSGWIFSRLAELIDAPLQIIPETDSTMLVLTYSSLSRIGLDGSSKLLVYHGDWDGLIPRSLLIDGKGFAYVGFTQRVAKVNLKTGNTVYLIPYPEIFEEDMKKYNEKLDGSKK